MKRVFTAALVILMLCSLLTGGFSAGQAKSSNYVDYDVTGGKLEFDPQPER